jgi:hypothetical protein
MVLNATFNNISVISWQSVLLVEETGVPGENNRPVATNSYRKNLKLEDTKRVIRARKVKDRKCNGELKTKKTSNYQQIISNKTKD